MVSSWKKNRKTKLRPLRIAHQYYEYQRKVRMNPSSLSYHDPSPSLSLVDETCKEWREEVTTDEEKSIDRYVSPPLVCEILEESEYIAESIYAMGHAISVTDISHRDSTGAPKKPCSSLLAIH